jgi:DNA transposition AAA+ family ATPase
MSTATPDTIEDKLHLLPAHQREILAWWHAHMRNNALSLNDLARRTGVSSSALSTAFNGKYGAKLDGLCKTLEAAKANLHQSSANPHFIVTALAKQVWELLDETRSLATVMFLWGNKGIGKTEVAMEYKRKDHVRTCYHRCSPGITRDQFATSLATSIGVDARGNHMALRDRMVAKLGLGQRELILDEFHEIFIGKIHGQPNPHAVLICEYLREIYDLAQCGLSIFGTKALVTNFKSAVFEAALEQLLDRGLPPVELPAKPTKADAAAFVRHYGLDPAELVTTEPEAGEIIKRITEASGLRKLTLHLRGGAIQASKADEPYAWKHFLAAYKRLASITSSQTTALAK